jgi:hypothetical protein
VNEPALIPLRTAHLRLQRRSVTRSMALIDNGGVVIISSRPQARHVIVAVFETQQRHDTHTALQCDEPHISNHRHASANLKDADAVQRVELVDQSSAHQGHLGRSYKICSRRRRRQRQRRQQQQQQQQMLLRSPPYQPSKDGEGDVIRDAVGKPSAALGEELHLTSRMRSSDGYGL